MKYAIVSGSTRQSSQSNKVANFVSQHLAKDFPQEHIHLIDFANHHFPLWDEGIWSQGMEWHPGWAKISKQLQAADAIIVVVPEWNGMVPPQLINFFQLCSHGELSHKPGLLVSVSSGQGGAYPIAELRMNSFKNTKICYIPEHIIIRDVVNVLNHPEQISNDADKYIRDRLSHTLSLLHLYAIALKTVRNEKIVSESNYPYGM